MVEYRQYDVLFIPAMSVVSETVFSGYGTLLELRRNRLQDDGVVAHECLRVWKRQNLR